jgi:hypothetical protein
MNEVENNQQYVEYVLLKVVQGLVCLFDDEFEVRYFDKIDRELDHIPEIDELIMN